MNTWLIIAIIAVVLLLIFGAWWFFLRPQCSPTKPCPQGQTCNDGICTTNQNRVGRGRNPKVEEDGWEDVDGSPSTRLVEKKDK